MKINSISNTYYSKGVAFKNKNHVSARHLNNIGGDSVSFGSSKTNFVEKPINVDIETAKTVAKSLSNSTSGHRAPYMSKTFTPEIVRLITLGAAAYAKDNAMTKNRVQDGAFIIIGGDTRKATREFLPLIRDTLIRQGVRVLDIKEPVPTPLIAQAAKDCNIDLAVLMTASHNPWSDGGYNFITSNGAVASAGVTQKIAKSMTDFAQKGFYTEQKNPEGITFDFNPYSSYLDALQDLELIDFDKIKKSGVEIFYDGLNGTGEYVMPRLFDEFGIPYTEVKSSGQEGPNPTDENLALLKETVSKSDKKLKIGLANDGDADRFGIIDENGTFVSPNDVLLLVGYHLAKNKSKKGDIIRSQATSMQLDKLASMLRTGVNVTPVGFKYIAEDIMQKRIHGRDILIAGEESGGLTVNGHIPEKDGIIADALIADLVATEGRPISEILKSLKKQLGIYSFVNNFSERFENDKKKNQAMDRVCDFWLDKTNASEENSDFDPWHKIDKEATIIADSNIRSYRPGGDGYKFIMTDGSTVLIRKSGTEPLIRCYIEATGKNTQRAYDNSEILKSKIDELLDV